VSVFAIIILSSIGLLFKVRPATSACHMPRQWKDQSIEFRTCFFSKPGFIIFNGGDRVDLLIPYVQQSNHETMMGSTKDPEDGGAVAGMIFTAVLVYVVFLHFSHFLSQLQALALTASDE
jgi:hypothetical protein